MKWPWNRRSRTINTLCRFGPKAIWTKNYADLDEKIRGAKNMFKSALFIRPKKMPPVYIVLKISHFNTLPQSYFDRLIWYQNFLFISYWSPGWAGLQTWDTPRFSRLHFLCRVTLPLRPLKPLLIINWAALLKKNDQYRFRKYIIKKRKYGCIVQNYSSV